MKTYSFYFALVACLLIGGAARADNIYTYTLNLPEIVSGAETPATTQYAFSWVGPYEYNAPPNSDCPTVCGPVIAGSAVKAGYYFSEFTFTADLALDDPEILVNFTSDTDPSDTVMFTLTEPDSFWATTGTFNSFPTANPGEGASYAIGGTDPSCTYCTVTISEAPATPEPRTSMLLAGPLALFGFALWRKRAKAIG